jgi:hypothetical protein
MYLNIVCFPVHSYGYRITPRDVFATSILNGRRYDVMYQIIVLFTEFSWGGYNILLGNLELLESLRNKLDYSNLHIFI